MHGVILDYMHNIDTLHHYMFTHTLDGLADGDSPIRILPIWVSSLWITEQNIL